MKIFLVLYFLLFFGLAMVLPSCRIWKTTGVNPYKLGSSDSAHDYIGKLFRLVIAGCGLVVLAFALFPTLYGALLPVTQLHGSGITVFGSLLLIFALIWVLIA